MGHSSHDARESGREAEFNRMMRFPAGVVDGPMDLGQPVNTSGLERSAVMSGNHGVGGRVASTVR